MAYYRVRIEVWCDWDPAASDLNEIVEHINSGDAICLLKLRNGCIVHLFLC